MPKKQKRSFKQNTLAIVYDFDGTLCPKPMQEYTVLPKLGIDGKTFWAEVDEEWRREKADPMLTYMRLMLKKLELAGEHLEPKDLAALASEITYFKGVETWFDRINQYVADAGKGMVKLRHYVISAGQQEILEGISIKKHFHRIYASRYHFNQHGVGTFANLVVTDTVKTQFLFRINKGKEDLHESINDHMPEADRPIPFPHMIYIGDGMSDVPGMAVTKQNGGAAVAVYQPHKKGAKQKCIDLYMAKRIDFFCPADYRAKGRLETCVQRLLDVGIARVLMLREQFSLEAGV